MDLCYHGQHLVCFVLCLVYISGHLTVLAADDICSCQRYSCNKCSSAGPCTRINVALGKTASASSLYNNTQWGASGPACLVVNGNLQTEFVNMTNNNPACVHTADNDYSPHWEVDLGGQYAISSITVYGREEIDRNMLMSATVTVDDKLCYSFAPDYYRPLITEITCSQNLTGSKVRFQKLYNISLAYLSMCQVQVWVCNDSYYGPHCTNTCRRCLKGSCDPWSGECLQGCSAGYQAPDCKETCGNGSYGVNCTNRCGNCSNGTCHPEDGVCSGGCVAGYQPPYCNKTCDEGWYGVSCNMRCGNCSSGSTCDVYSGVCPEGCSKGYQLPYCNESCNVGLHGADCQEPCGNCTGNTTCDIYDGRCEAGCAAGYKLPLCKHLCSPGTYGPNCNNTCGSCSEGTTCNAFNGECPQDCEPGYLGSHCNESCRDGTYGVGCKETCGNCTGNSPCNVSDGRCQTGCAAGYLPPLCKEVCSSGLYGHNCSSSCDNRSEGTTSAPVSGECPKGCNPGFQGSLSKGDKDDQSVNTAGPIAGAVVGSVACGLTGFLLGVLFMRFRHRQREDKKPSAVSFSEPLETELSSSEPTFSSDNENANVSTKVYDSLKASHDDNTASDYTSLGVRRTGDVKASPYVNRK